MINNSPIVKDTRKVRNLISKSYEHQPDKFINDLISKQEKNFSKKGAFFLAL
ncbi:hypothetical protein MHK_002956 [Candidatus Magnetomorum sp. HK-1]|nr:hypothetical protein MHK_002956 [Candidatus Magnetomorum sp. HK-1]